MITIFRDQACSLTVYLIKESGNTPIK